MPKKQIYIDSIDPTAIDYSDKASLIDRHKAKLLDLFLQQQEEKNKNRNIFQRLFSWKTKRFKKGEIQEVYVPNPANPTNPFKKKFTLTHDIVFSHAKIKSVGKKIPEYNVIDPDAGLLGKGVWGSVVSIAGVLTRRNGPLSFKKTKQFVDKIQSSSPTAAAREAKILRKLHREAKRILVEKVDLIQKVTHIVDRNYGISLTKFMQNADNRKLSFEKRLAISVNLLRALQRVHAFGYIHHDIWPNNILVDPTTCEARIIDFGSAKKTTDFFQLGGKPTFAAPEKYSLGKVDQRSDIFSLMLCLAVFWGAKPRTGFEFSENLLEAMQTLASLFFHHQDNFSLAKLGQQLEVPIDQIPILQSIFEKGLTFNPEDRASLDQIINHLEYIRIQKQYPGKPEVYQAHLLANQTRSKILQLEKSHSLITGKKGNQSKTALTRLVSDLQQGLSSLGDSQPEIEEFIHTLGIKAFQGLKRKEAIAKLATNIIGKFIDYNTRLQKEYNLIEGKLALFMQNRSEEDQPYIDFLQTQLNQLYYVIYKMESHSINLDELVKINRHCEKRLQRVEAAFTEKEKDPKFKAPSPIHQIFNRLTLSTDENPIAHKKNNIRLALRDYILRTKTVSATRIADMQDILRVIDNPATTKVEDLEANLKKPLKRIKNSLGFFQHSELLDRVKRGLKTEVPRFKAGRLV